MRNTPLLHLVRLACASCLVLLAARADAYDVGQFVSSVFDASRSREIAYTLYYPEGYAGVSHVLLFSHGGAGSPTGHTRLGHFGTRWAAAGYVGIHVNHLESGAGSLHTRDTPADVSFVLDRLQAGTLPLPPEFAGSLALSAFGHAGHSFGAYTSMALAGGQYLGQPSFRDPRIVAVAPVSPQGAGEFGGFDAGPAQNTWWGIDVPVFDLVGALEKDSNAIGTIQEEDWRLTPFLRFPDVADKFQVILPGQDHGHMGALALPAVQQYVAENTRLFFDVYLRGQSAGVCGIGTSPAFPGQVLAARSDPVLGLASACDPPVGAPRAVPLPGFVGAGIALALLGIARRSRPLSP